MAKRLKIPQTILFLPSATAFSSPFLNKNCASPQKKTRKASPRVMGIMSLMICPKAMRNSLSPISLAINRQAREGLRESEIFLEEHDDASKGNHDKEGNDAPDHEVPAFCMA